MDKKITINPNVVKLCGDPYVKVDKETELFLVEQLEKEVMNCLKLSELTSGAESPKVHASSLRQIFSVKGFNICF